MGDDSSAKYHQVAVPDHPGGNSFVRVGSFPSAGDPAPLPASYEKGRSLAGVASASRLTTSGHWSHTDGNRVTTTVGNVVDVIQGAYVAYRSAAASPPGPALAATWASSSYIQTGSEDYPVGFGAAGPDPTGSPPADSLAYANATTDTNGADSKAAVGDAILATWAGRVITYVGSSSKPATYVFTQTYGGKVATYTYTTVDNETLVKATGGDVTTTVDVSGGGGVTTSTTVAGGNVLTKTEANAITATNTAAAITNVNTALNTYNQNFGIIENTNFGAVFNVNMGFTTNITLGGQFNFAAPEKWDLTPESTTITGIKNDIGGLKGDISVTATSIASMKSHVSVTEQKLTAAEDKISAAATKITAAETRLSEVESTVGAQADRIIDNEINIGICNTDLRDLIFGV